MTDKDIIERLDNHKYNNLYFVTMEGQWQEAVLIQVDIRAAQKEILSLRQAYTKNNDTWAKNNGKLSDENAALRQLVKDKDAEIEATKESLIIASARAGRFETELALCRADKRVKS